MGPCEEAGHEEVGHEEEDHEEVGRKQKGGKRGGESPVGAPSSLQEFNKTLFKQDTSTIL